MAKKTSSSKLPLDSVSEYRSRSSDSLTRRPLREAKEKSEESSEDENKITEESSKEENETKDSPLKHESSPSSVHNKEKRSTVNEPPIQDKNRLLLKSIFVILIVCGIGFVYYSKTEEKREVNLSQIIGSMKNQFRQQHPLTYKFLQSQLKNVVNVMQEPSAPAILTLMANKGAETTASEFSQYLAKALTSGKYISINESTYWNDDQNDIAIHHEIKLKIDEEIKSNYRQNQLNVIIVDKLQKIPFEAAMIFHSYCDHEHSPYKRAVFLFIVPLKTTIPENAGIADLDLFAMESLRNIWHSASDDKVDSLITRMTVSVLNIK